MTTETTYLAFDRDPAAGILHEWWTGLDQNRGERAELRRCRSPDEVVFTPAYHRLRTTLLNKGYRPNIERLALVAGVISQVRNNTETGKFAKLMAAKKEKGGNSPVSEIRFRRLLTIDSPAELYPVMTRLVKLTGGTAPLSDLADGLYWWNDQKKKFWAIAYYEQIV